MGQQLAQQQRMMARKRPSNASRSVGSLAGRRPLASSASTAGSWVPETSASSIARPEAPSTSLATVPSSGPGVLQDLGQPLGLTGPLAGQRRAVAGQNAQLPDRLGRHEPGSDQAVRNQLTDPHRVGHIGLGPGHGAQGAAFSSQHWKSSSSR